MKVCPGKVGAGVAVAASHKWTKVHPELIGDQACLKLALCVFIIYPPTAASQCVGEDQHRVPLCHHVWKGAVKDIDTSLHQIKNKVRRSWTKEKAWLLIRKEVN